MTQSAESPVYILSKPGRTRWAAWIVLWTLTVATLVALLANNAHLDTQLSRATRWAVGDGDYYKWADYYAAHAADTTRPFYMVESPPMESHFYQTTAWLWKSFKFFGDPWTAIIIMTSVCVLIKAKSRPLALSTRAGGTRKAGDISALVPQFRPAILLAACATLPPLAGWLIRICNGRFRPTHTDATNTWELFRGFHDGHDLSFPSGHATLAFSLAACLAFLYPRARWIALPLAAACAFSRVVMEAHFYSDILAGAVLGWSVSWFVCKLVANVLPPPAPPAAVTNI